MDALSQETITILGVGVVLAGFFWSLQRDLTGLRDRISRLEGLFEGLRDSVAGLGLRVAGLETAVGGLAAGVTGMETAVTGVRDSVNRLEQRVDNRFPLPSAADD